MKRFAVMILSVAISVMVWSPAWAVSTTLQYTEPTLNADGTPLQDLAITSAFCNLLADGVGPFRMDTPATVLGGGGSVSATFDLVPSTQHGLSSTGVHIFRRQIIQALLITLGVVIVDEP